MDRLTAAREGDRTDAASDEATADKTGNEAGEQDCGDSAMGDRTEGQMATER